jgi:mannan endo-1,4-beta-mannosidase
VSARLASSRPLLIGAYYLHEMTARALLGGTDPRAPLDAIFDVVRRAGAIGVRTLATHVGEGATAIQSSSREVRELGLHALDLLLARASRAGVGLVLSLGNSWDDYGGARAITGLAGHPAPVEADLRFFVSPRARAVYRFGMRAILTRVSREDGHMLGAHPAVLAWEPMNEPRSRGLDRGGRAMRFWLDGTSSEIASLAPGKPISSGEEGLDVSLRGRDARFWRSVGALHLFRRRQSFTRNAASPGVDHPSVHVYPDAWCVPPQHHGEAGERFLRESAALSAGKRLLVGEMGAVGHARLDHLARWVRVTWSLGGIPGIWMLASPHAPRNRDRYALEEAELVPWARSLRRP